MNKLILTINKLQQLNSKYDLPDIQLPQIIVVGSQSSGKSSVMERIIGHDILPKAATVATRCPIILQLVYSVDMGNELKAIFMDSSTPVFGIENISDTLQIKTNKIGKSNEAVSSEPIILQLFGSTHPTLTLIDLPGLIKNDGELPPGSTEKILHLTEQYAASSNSIILAISAANVDLANSDAIHIAKKFDPESRRTLHVITKIDLMDRGTTISDILRSKLLANGLPPICVVNRSQESVTNKLTIQESNEYERQFIESKGGDIYGDHGIGVLVTTLVNKLEGEILKNLPSIQDSICKRIESIKSDLEFELDTINNKDIIINKTLTKFISEYKKMITGEREHYPDTIMGGAKISHILYEEYEKEIFNFAVTKRTKENILILLKNTAGNKKVSYSIENAFGCIIRDEVEKFKSASLRCNDTVMILLVEFIPEIIREFQLNKYVNLASSIERVMQTFINRKHTFSKMIIENIIRGEKEDIFCLRPNTVMFESLDSKYKSKIAELNEKSFKDIIDKVAKDYNVLLLPPIKKLLVNAYNSKCLSILKDTVTQYLDDQTPNLLSKNQTTRFAPAIPTILTDMVNKVTDNGIEMKAIYDYLAKDKQFPMMINEMIIKSMNTNVVEGNEQNPNIFVLEDMVSEYFKVVQESMIRNVPKWIQTVFVKDLLLEIDDALHCIRREDDLESLLNIGIDEANRIELKKEELEELQCVYEELKTLRRQR